MKDFVGYLKKYISAYYNRNLYLSIGLFLGLAIVGNFGFGAYDWLSYNYSGQWVFWPIMSLFMAFPFVLISGLVYLFTPNKAWANNPYFWLQVFVGFVIMGFERSFFMHKDWAANLNGVDYTFYIHTMSWGRTFITTFVPLLLFYYLYNRHKQKSQNWYGLRLDSTNYGLYLWLIFIVFGGMFLASYLSELSSYYPRYKHSAGAQLAQEHGISPYIPVFIYELIYGASFINVELFFRGFLVIGFARFFGPHAVLAMVGSYVFLHFGKPFTECLSSAIGGYALGILAFYSQRSWGGVILHISLAWSMDLFAWWQNS